jgi:hypothetical protein
MTIKYYNVNSRSRLLVAYVCLLDIPGASRILYGAVGKCLLVIFERFDEDGNGCFSYIIDMLFPVMVLRTQ